MTEMMTTIELIRVGALSWDELAGLAMHDHQTIRGAAIQALIERYGAQDRTIELLRSLALEPRNRTPMMGTISLAHVCMKHLHDSSSEHARASYAELLSGWPAEDRNDLDWFIRRG